MAKMKRIGTKGGTPQHNPIGDGKAGFGRANSASTATRIGGDQGAGGSRGVTARRISSKGVMSPRSPGHVVGCRTK